jgi:rhodanese-related sulfurtransferase
MNRQVRRIILEAAVIVTLGALIGLSLHHRLLLDVFAGRTASPPARPVTTGTVAAYPSPVDLAEVEELLAAGGLPVDARNPEIFQAGHLPGAYSLPLADVSEEIGSFRDKVHLDTILIVYCGGYGCADSFDLAVRLIAEGYRDVRVYEGGFPEWRDANRSVAKGER